MIVTIQAISQEFTKTGAEYRKVTGVTGDGKQTTKSVFDNLKDKWPLLKENASLEFKMVQKGQFWNVTDISELTMPPPQEPTMLPGEQKIIDEALRGKPSGQEVGMWWKQLGDDLRSGHIDKSTPQGKLLRAAYFAQMFSVLNISVSHQGNDKKE